MISVTKIVVTIMIVNQNWEGALVVAIMLRWGVNWLLLQNLAIMCRGMIDGKGSCGSRRTRRSEGWI